MTYLPKTYHKQGGDEIVVASGGKITIESGGAIEDPAGVSLMQDVLCLDIADGSADTTYYVVAPHAGTISKIWTVIDGVVGTADITVQAAIGAQNLTNGLVTITQAGSAAGDVDSATPTANNTVTAGQAIKFTVAGGGAGGSPRIHLACVIQR